MLSSFAAMFGYTAGDPFLQDNLDGTTTATWSFQNPANYTVNNVSIAPGNASLEKTVLQFVDTSLPNFQAGQTQFNIDLTSEPGNVTISNTLSAGTPQFFEVPIAVLNGTDAWIDGRTGRMDRNCGICTTLSASLDDGAVSYDHRMVLFFNLSQLQGLDMITNSEVALRLSSALSSVPVNITVHQVNAAWLEGTGDYAVSNDGVSWNTVDGFTSWTNGGDFNPIPEDTVYDIQDQTLWYRWVITQLVRDWINGTRANYGVILVQDMGVVVADNEKFFHSKESAIPGSRPRLRIEYISTEGGRANGTFISRAMDAQSVVEWVNVSWNSTLPSQTNMTIQTRTGDCAGTWTGWSPSYLTSSGSTITSPQNRCIQYKVEMETFNRTHLPRLEEVRIDYLTHNSEGTVETEDFLPTNWVSWEEFNASFVAPPGTNVSFWYSTDSGSSWNATAPGQSLQSVASPTIRFRANLTTSDGRMTPNLFKFNMTYQFYDTLDHIHMSIASWSGTTDEWVDLDGIGHDGFHHVTPFIQKWETDDPWGSVDSAGLYLPGMVGSWRVYCNDTTDSTSNFTVVNVFAGSTSRIGIDPWDVGTLTTVDARVFNATEYDSKGNTIGPAAVNWSVTGGIGTIPIGPSSSASFDPTTPGLGTVNADDGIGHTNSTNIIQVVTGSRYAVGIEPWSPGTLTADESVNLTAYEFDADGNQIGTANVTWMVNGGIGTVQAGPSNTTVFEATTVGVGTVSIDDGLAHTNVSDLITVVAGALDRVVVQPNNITIPTGDFQNFTATGYDLDGNVVSLIGPTWTTNAGNITSSSSTSATLKAQDTENLNGWIRLTAANQGNITGTADLEVLEMNVVPTIVGTIPDQLKPEDYGTWSLDLSSYASDPQDTLSELTWSFTGHTTSLTAINGDDIQGNHLITFTTVPNAFGTDELTIWLRDSDGYVDAQTMYITISSVNDRPTIQSITPFTIHFDEPYTYYFYDYIQDVETAKANLNLSSDDPEHILFNGQWGTFLYPEAFDGTTVYPIVTVHDEDGGQMSTVLAITVSDDYVPVLVQELPDVVLFEGEEAKDHFNLDDYFDDPDEDSLFYTSGNVHTEITIHENHSVDFKAPEDWNGVETVSFRGIDPENARAEDIILVTVIPVNDPPTISGVPDLIVHYEDPSRPFYNYTFDLDPYVEDVDNVTSELFITTSDPTHIFFNSSVNTVMEIHYPESMRGQSVTVRITVSDGLSNGYQDMNITILDDWPPEIVSVIRDYSFFEDTSLPDAFNIGDCFADNDADELTFSSFSSDVIVSINSSTSLVSFSSTQDWFGYEYVTFRATDPDGAISEQTAKVTVIPVNDAPEILDIPDMTITKGHTYTLDLRDYVLDIDNNFSELIIFVTGDHPKTTVILAGSILILDYPFEGTDVIRIDASDGNKSAFSSFNVRIVGEPAPSLWDQIYWPWSLIVAILLSVIFVLFSRGFFSRIHIDEAFLIYKNGSLIHHTVVGEQTNIDEDIFSNMLTAIQEFIRDSFREVEDSPVKQIEFGDRKIAMERGEHLFLAVVYRGRETRWNIEPIREAIEEIEDTYGAELENWDGFVQRFAGVHAILSRHLVDLKKSRSTEDIDHVNGNGENGNLDDSESEETDSENSSQEEST
jgi:hypothetical protein